MSEQPSQGDATRDMHLLAALRHAPDRGLTPPAHVTAAILDQARRATAQQRPLRAYRWRASLSAALDRLWQPAPVAAFMTLAMATLIGVMWGGQQPPDATSSLRGERAAAAPAEPARDAGKKPAATGGAAIAPAAREPAQNAALSTLGANEVLPRRLAKKPSSESTPPAAAAPRESRQDASLADAARSPVVSSPPPLAAGLPVQGEMRAKAQAQPSPAAARTRDGVAEGRLDAAATSAAASPAALAEEIASAASADPNRVQWRVPSRRLIAHEAAQRDWWSALIGATAGRWQPVPGAAAPSEPWLELIVDGSTRLRLWFEGDALIWSDAQARAWRAPVSAEQQRDWQAAVARW